MQYKKERRVLKDGSLVKRIETETLNECSIIEGVSVPDAK